MEAKSRRRMPKNRIRFVNKIKIIEFQYSPAVVGLQVAFVADARPARVVRGLDMLDCYHQHGQQDQR